MTTCIICGGSPIEANNKCASCNHDERKAAREALKPKKPIHTIRHVSKKQAKALIQYTVERAAHLKEHPFCQIRLAGCWHRATQVHHCAKRGKNLNNRETFKSACDNCHNIVEFSMSAQERRELGLLI